MLSTSNGSVIESSNFYLKFYKKKKKKKKLKNRNNNPCIQVSNYSSYSIPIISTQRITISISLKKKFIGIKHFIQYIYQYQTINYQYL